MKKTLLAVVVCVLCGAIKGQTSAQYTFQGEIVGISSLILYFKLEDDVMTGFYKSLSDSVIVQFRGNIDSEGNLMFTTTKKPYLSFSGKLEGRVIKGQSIRSGNATFHTFYACNLRGIYKSANGDVFDIALSDKGYLRNGNVYRPTPDGYCGDEDNGQTSAWYVFSSLGFYPVCPGSDQYVIGAPLVRKATITLENGHKIEISAPDNTPENCYIRSLRVDGREYDKNYFSYGDLIKGTTLQFDMSHRPNKKRGIHLSAFPYSFSDQKIFD